VGTGPFPTELFDETGEFLRKEGREFGATTGRPRRCGWFDAVLVRQAVRLNGITSLAVTKLDVLDALETLRIATGYRIPSGEIVATLPSRNVKAVEPTYEEMPGWQCPTVGIATVEELPAAMRAYLDRLSELVGASVSIISTGPRREETIVLDSANFWQ
jgi:adenylosuccinate synthase